MAHHPAFTVGSICIAGGIMGFVKARSVPSLVAGVTSGLLLVGSGYMIREGMDYGFETAFATSAALAAFSGLRGYRTRKAPMIGLAAVTTISTAYYGKWLYDFRKK